MGNSEAPHIDQGIINDSARLDCQLVLKPYLHLRHELSVNQNCLMWGLRVIIPPSLQQSVLAELQRAHPGITRMKAIACSHVWWPGLDSNIEEIACQCKQCCKTRKALPAPPLYPWKLPTTPLKRIQCRLYQLSRQSLSCGC